MNIYMMHFISKITVFQFYKTTIGTVVAAHFYIIGTAIITHIAVGISNNYSYGTPIGF